MDTPVNKGNGLSHSRGYSHDIYLDVIYRRKWFIIFPIIICTGLAAVLAYNIPPSYRSNTLILIEPQQISQKYVTPTDTTPIEARINTLRQQIMSRTKLEQIIKKFNPYKKDPDEWKKNPLLDMLNKVKNRSNSILIEYGLGGFMEDQEAPSMELMVEKMRNDIEVKILGGGRRGGSAFTINYIGRDPYITMQITNAIASLYIEENLRVREQYTEGTSEFLVSELDKAKKELEEQEKNLREFKEKYMGYLPEQLDANLRTLDRLQLELQSVETSLRNLEEGKMLLGERLRNVGDRLLKGGGASA